MKQITLDWDTFQLELEEARQKGIKDGIWKASRYILKGEVYYLPEYAYFENECLKSALKEKYPVLIDSSSIQL